MIPLLLMLAADARPMTPVDAERAFAADAKTIGQWTAFRKWSTDDAVMFVPQPTNAHEFLQNRTDPQKVIDWWPTASYISCDGSLAVNTGGWKRPDGSVGYFSTVWQRQMDGGWKWIVDGGETLKAARSRRAMIRRASCRRALLGDAMAIGRMATGAAQDHSLTWFWQVQENGAREFIARIWTGRIFATVIDDKIAATRR